MGLKLDAKDIITFEDRVERFKSQERHKIRLAFDWADKVKDTAAKPAGYYVYAAVTRHSKPICVGHFKLLRDARAMMECRPPNRVDSLKSFASRFVYRRAKRNGPLVFVAARVVGGSGGTR